MTDGASRFIDFVTSRMLGPDESLNSSAVLWMAWKAQVLNDEQPLETRGLRVTDLEQLISDIADPWQDPFIGAAFQDFTFDGTAGIDQDMLWGWDQIGTGWSSVVRTEQGGQQYIANQGIADELRQITFIGDVDHDIGEPQAGADVMAVADMAPYDLNDPQGLAVGAGGGILGMGFTDVDSANPPVGVYWQMDPVGGGTLKFCVGTVGETPDAIFDEGEAGAVPTAGSYLKIHRVGQTFDWVVNGNWSGTAHAPASGDRSRLTIFSQNCEFVATRIKAYNRTFPARINL